MTAKKTPVEHIGRTLLELATANITPKELLRKTRKAHPSASKGEIVRAAFATVIAVSDSQIDKAALLQNFALRERGSE